MTVVGWLLWAVGTAALMVYSARESRGSVWEIPWWAAIVAVLLGWWLAVVPYVVLRFVASFVGLDLPPAFT